MVDDHRGLRPTAIRVNDEGMICDLHRSKTTGKDKKAAVRPACVSREAYFLEPQWLTTGLGVWKELAPQERDYLLVAPKADLNSVSSQELRYSEAVGWTQRLQREIGISQKGETEVDVITGHYSEHSGRFFLPSAAFAAGVPEEELKPLGGWSTNAARGYLLTTHRKIGQIQSYVGRLGRENWGHEDVFGESEALYILQKDLMKHDLPKERVEHIIARLTIFKKPLRQQLFWSTTIRSEGKASGQAAVSIPESSTTEPSPQGLEEVGEAATPPPCKRSRTDWYEKGRVPEEARGYVVSISGKRSFRRLHLLGACYRVPGIDYQEYELLGETLPAVTAYDDICGKCWPASTNMESKSTALSTIDLESEVNKEVESSGEDSSSTE